MANISKIKLPNNDVVNLQDKVSGYATTSYVDTAIANLPEPMIFKGSVGEGGTITSLPAASSANEGFTYKVISALSEPVVAKIGDTVISNGSVWTVIPSGDEPGGTVTSVATGSGLTGGPITTSGTISLATAYGDTVNPYGTKAKNLILAGPSTGSNAAPTFRALVGADVPNGNWLNGSQTGSVRTSSSNVENSTYTIGRYAVAEGLNTIASGDASHAEGSSTTASKASSHAEGLNTTASGVYSHAEGMTSTASGQASHAEGASAASGRWSHAEGAGTTASGLGSHAEGGLTTASGASSHASGISTLAQRKSQTAIGEFNIADNTGADGTVRGSYAFIIGNGTADDARSNALTVDWNGNVDIASGAKYKINGTALSASDIGALPSNHTYQTSIESSTGTSQVTLTHGGKYAITAGGTSYIFTMPSAQSVPTSATNSTTGITIGNHSTTTIYGVKSGTGSTTTASKASGDNGTAPTLGTAISVRGVKSTTTTASKASGGNGEAPALNFDIDGTDINQLNITWSAGSASTWSFNNVTVPVMDDNATSIPNVTSVGTASTWSFTDVTVPIRADDSTTVVTSGSHSITDNGHTHMLA